MIIGEVPPRIPPGRGWGRGQGGVLNEALGSHQQRERSKYLLAPIQFESPSKARALCLSPVTLLWFSQPSGSCQRPCCSLWTLDRIGALPLCGPCDCELIRVAMPQFLCLSNGNNRPAITMRTPGWLPGSTVLIYASCLAHHTYGPRQAPASLLAGGEGLSGKQANFSPDDTPLAASPVQTSPVKLEVQSVPHPQPAAERCCLFILVGPAALACLCLPPRTLSRASVAPPVSPWKAQLT